VSHGGAVQRVTSTALGNAVPLERSICSHPGCNEVVGGNSHVPAARNTRVGTYFEMHRGQQDRTRAVPGYCIAEEPYSYEVLRYGYVMPVANVCMLRLVLHLALAVGAQLHGPHTLQAIPRLTFPVITMRLQKDFARLKQELGWTSSQVVFAVHLALEKLEKIIVGKKSFETATDAENFEKVFNDYVMFPLFMQRKATRLYCLR